MEPKTVTIGNTEVKVTPFEGVIVDGEVTVSSIDVEILGENFMDLDTEINWDSEEEIKSQIRSAWMDTDEWPDTCTDDWDSPQIINAGSNAWEVLEAIVDNFPVTNPELEGQVSFDYSPSGESSNLEEKNLVACIGYEGRTKVYAPTHIGIKEVFEYNGLEISSGLDALFSNNGSAEGGGEEESEEEEEQGQLTTNYDTAEEP